MDGLVVYVLQIQEWWKTHQHPGLLCRGGADAQSYTVKSKMS